MPIRLDAALSPSRFPIAGSQSVGGAMIAVRGLWSLRRACVTGCCLGVGVCVVQAQAPDPAPAQRSISSSQSSGQPKAGFDQLRVGESESGRTRDVAVVINNAGNATSRVALVIGNASYQNVLQLANPRNDARDVCETLRALLFDVVCQFDIPSRNAFREVVRSFAAKLGPQTAAFFYYAGHGVQVNGENYLLPTAIAARSIADIEDEGLNLSYVLRSLEEARSSPNIVVVDACRDNPFTTLRFRGGAKGLARVDPPVGTILVYATAPNGVALDGRGRNGVFTKHLVRRMTEPGHRLDALFQGVARSVEEEARGFGIEQVPYRSSSYSGEFCLAGCDNPNVAAQIELIKQQSEDAAKRIAILTEENARLRQQAGERTSRIVELEARIDSLSREVALAGRITDGAAAELSRLQAALDAARAEQGAAEQQRSAVAMREGEIAQLKSQMEDLRQQAHQLEEYRRQVYSLERQSDETAKRMLALSAENDRLRQQAEERRSNIAQLEARIQTLSSQGAAVSREDANTRRELEQLRAALDRARSEQKNTDGLKREIATRESEIATLKTRMTEIEEKAQQLEANRQLDQRAKSSLSSRPVVVPSF